MIQIANNTITYKSSPLGNLAVLLGHKEFSFIEARCLIDGGDEPVVLAFAPSWVGDLIIDKETGLPVNDKCRLVDNDIYAYLPDELFDLRQAGKAIEAINNLD